MEVGLYFLFKKTPKLLSNCPQKLGFVSTADKTRELFTRYCQYPVSLLNFLKIYVFNKKKSVVGKRK